MPLRYDSHTLGVWPLLFDAIPIWGNLGGLSSVGTPTYPENYAALPNNYLTLPESVITALSNIGNSGAWTITIETMTEDITERTWNHVIQGPRYDYGGNAGLGVALFYRQDYNPVWLGIWGWQNSTIGQTNNISPHDTDWHRWNIEYQNHLVYIYRDGVLYYSGNAGGNYNNPFTFTNAYPYSIGIATYPYGNEYSTHQRYKNLTISDMTLNGNAPEYVIDPVINLCTPRRGKNSGGTSVVLSGSDFLAGATVKFGSVTAANITVVSSTEITCTAPAHTAGSVDITITNTDGGSVTATNIFKYISYTIAPTTGSGAGGDTLTITGDDFTSGLGIKLGTAIATNVSITNATALTCLSPIHGAGYAALIIVYADGEIVDTGLFYLYTAAPYCTAAAIFEKNRLSSTGVWIYLLEITIPGISETIKICKNTEKITWNGSTYQAFPFSLNSMSENSTNEIPTLQIQISNITREIQAMLESTNGAAGATLKLMLIHNKHLADTEPTWQGTFALLSAVCDEQWVTLSVGQAYSTSSRRPLWTEQKYICRWHYGDICCAVAAATKTTYPACDKSIASCKIRGNDSRYGAELSIPGGYYGPV